MSMTPSEMPLSYPPPSTHYPHDVSIGALAIGLSAHLIVFISQKWCPHQVPPPHLVILDPLMEQYLVAFLPVLNSNLYPQQYLR